MLVDEGEESVVEEVVVAEEAQSMRVFMRRKGRVGPGRMTPVK